MLIAGKLIRLAAAMRFLRTKNKNLWRTFAVLLVWGFTFQIFSLGEEHAFHGTPVLQSAAGHVQDGKNSSVPEESRCEFCLTFRAADPASAISAPALALSEAAFSVLARFVSFDYSASLFFSLARGPPSLA